MAFAELLLPLWGVAAAAAVGGVVLTGGCGLAPPLGSTEGAGSLGVRRRGEGSAGRPGVGLVRRWRW